MHWRQLAVESRYPDFVEELMSSAGAEVISQVDAADDPVLEPAPGATPLWVRTRTLGLFPADADLEAVRRTLRENLPDGDSLCFDEALIEDRDWVRAWLQHARPMRFGERLWICPSGHHVAAPDAVVIDLDPGLAFGTGHHPSTALCLEWLSAATLEDKRVLDYGCGSGVLAIAALKLGAGFAKATDIDAQALQATAANAAHNGVEARLQTAPPEDFDPPTAGFDIVLANILARPLCSLAPRLAGLVKPGGHVVLAGILHSQCEAVRKCYAPWFEFEPPGRREDWVRLDGRRRF